MDANLLKTVGYLISTLSVALLGVVAWVSAEGDTGLRIAVLVGVASSVAGMFLRWLSYQAEERAPEPSPRRTSRA